MDADTIRTELDKIASISELADITGVSYAQLYKWSTESEKNGFPPVAEQVGRYKFYDTAEVVKWVYLWQRATKGMGRGAALNGHARD